MKNSTKKVIALSLVTGTFLVGCGDTTDEATNQQLNTLTSSTTVEQTSNQQTYTGIAADPELQGSTVFLDDNENGLLDSTEPSTTTDKDGKYTLTISQDQVGKPIIVIGGVDKSTKEDFTGKLTVLTQENIEITNITPLTTLVYQYILDNPDMDIEEIKAELATKLNLQSSDELDVNTAEAGHEEALKVALEIEKVAQFINENKQDLDTTDIYNSLAEKLQTTQDLTTALDSVINEHLEDELEQAKAKDLNHELQQLDHSQFANKDSLALSVENIDDKIHNTTNKDDLKTDLAHDDTLLVHSDDEIQKIQEEKMLKHLGLENLSDEEKQAILAQIDLEDDPKHIEEKIHNNELEGLDYNTELNVKRDAFFKALGLSELDKETLEKLNQKFSDANFDFTKASLKDVADKINDDTFMGDDIEFNATVRASLKISFDINSSLSTDKKETKKQHGKQNSENDDDNGDDDNGDDDNGDDDNGDDDNGDDDNGDDDNGDDDKEDK